MAASKLVALGLLMFAVSASVVRPVSATPVQYEFSGTVRYAYPANGPVHVGDPYRGTMFYDPDGVVVRYAIDGLRFYDFPRLPGAGLRIDVSNAAGVFTFANVPGYIAIEILNDFSYTGQGLRYDEFFLFCTEFTNFPTFYRRLYTTFYLDIYSSLTSFLDSTDLPSNIGIPAGAYSGVWAYGGSNFGTTDYYVNFSIDRLALANHPPDCSAAVGRIPSFSAVNGAMAPVTIDGVTDPDGDPISIQVTGVSQDEPVVDIGARPTCPDAVIDAGAAQVRLERSGAGNGRVYRVAFTATDGRGGSSDGAVSVCVPHDQSGAPCVDDGTVYDSTKPCPAGLTLSAAATEGTDLAVARTGGRGVVFDFSLSKPGEVSLTVHDIAGRTVATLARAWYDAGTHHLDWKTESGPPGIYFVRLRTPGASVVRRFAVLQ